MTANLVRRARQFFTAHGGRLAKYLTGSVIAGIIAMATVALTFGSALLGSKGAALAGSTTGAIANYFLNRRWTWGRRGRADFRKELVPYWITVVVTAFIAAVVTGAANAVVREITPDRGVRAVTNALAFQAVYGVSFIVKYHIFHRLFHERDPLRWTETRATRTQWSMIAPTSTRTPQRLPARLSARDWTVS